jgi:hypothetical protein
MARTPYYEFGDLAEGQNLIVKARITTDLGTRVSSLGGASSIAATGVTIKVFDVTRPAGPPVVENATTTLAVTTAFTTDAVGYLLDGWETDAVGYNFLAVIPDGTGAGFTVDWKANHSYRVEVTVTTGATINPGAQLEGPISFSGIVFVETGLGVS